MTRPVTPVSALRPVSDHHLHMFRKARGNPETGEPANIFAMIAALKAVSTDEYIPVEELYESVRALSAKAVLPSGRKPKGFIFGSGTVSPNFREKHAHSGPLVGYGRYTKMLVKGGHDLAVITDTEQARLVQHEAFLMVFQKALRVANPGRDPEKLLNESLMGKIGTDGRRSPGLWDEVSANYAINASGMIITVTPNALADRIFVQSELPELLTNPQITCMNGKPIEDFRDYFYDLVQKGMSNEEACKKLNHDEIKISSIVYLTGYAGNHFLTDMSPALRFDFTGAHSPDFLNRFRDCVPPFSAHEKDLEYTPVPEHEYDGNEAHVLVEHS